MRSIFISPFVFLPIRSTNLASDRSCVEGVYVSSNLKAVSALDGPIANQTQLTTRIPVLSVLFAQDAIVHIAESLATGRAPRRYWCGNSDPRRINANREAR